MTTTTIPARAPEGEELYNTAVTVVANLHAASDSDAVEKLATCLRAHGFDVITDPGGPSEWAAAFIAEEGTEASDLPPMPLQRSRG